MTVLSDDDRDRLFLIVQNRCVGDGTWADALFPLLPAYRQTLPDGGNAGTKLFQTIVTLNNSGRLIDGTLPMEAVLSKLKFLTADAAVRDLTSELLGRIDSKFGMAKLPAYAALDGQPEAYTGASDDTLPFDFLSRGHSAGRAVIKLVVPRFENGQRAVGASGPRTFNGTGWLIARDLVLTNFHVICARESDEADPSAADLKLQVENTLCHFNYDRDRAEPVVVPVESAASWGARGGPRDYAVLRVKPTDAWPEPLALRRQPPSVPKEGYPVNIIQHPAGLPKRVAARANLLKAATAQKLEYFGDTLGGSSGSPLCNDAWEVIGLHRASGPSTGVFVKGKAAAAFNEGIPIDAILTDLSANAAAVYDEVKKSILP